MGLESKRAHRYLITSAALSFLLLTSAIVTIYNTPMRGYEYSVYASTPFLFWISIIVSLLVGIVLFSVYYGRSRALCSVGLFEILLSNFILISMYLYRGFIYIERSDSQSYVGYAKDIVQSGFIPSSNFYPMVSVEMVSTGVVTNQSMVLMSQIFPALFFTIYTVGMLCWSKTIINKPLFVTSMMLASMPIFFAWFIPTIFHETFCVLALPLFYFVLWRSRSQGIGYKTLGAMMILFFTGGHPLVAVSVLVVLVVIFLFERIVKEKQPMVSTTVINFCMVILLGWIVYNAVLVESIQEALEQLVGMFDGVSTLGSAQGQASQLGVLSALQSILVCTIDDAIFVLMSLFLGLTMIRWKRWKKHPMNVVMACFLGGGVFIAALVAFTFTHNPFRMINLNFVMIFTVPLVGYALYVLRRDRKVFRARIITALILFCMVSTVFTVYQDPMEVFSNGAFSRSEVVGSNWFLTDMAENRTIHCLQTTAWRFADLLYGGVGGWENLSLRFAHTETTAHFNSFYNSSNSTDYMIVTMFDVMTYTVTWKAIEKFTTSDFQVLKVSDSAIRIYANPCYSIYART